MALITQIDCHTMSAEKDLHAVRARCARGSARRGHTPCHVQVRLGGGGGAIAHLL